MKKRLKIALAILIVAAAAGTGYVVYDKNYKTIGDSGKTTQALASERSLLTKAAHDFGKVKKLSWNGLPSHATSCELCKPSGKDLGNRLIFAVYHTVKLDSELNNQGWSALPVTAIALDGIKAHRYYSKVFDGQKVCLDYTVYTEPDLHGNNNGATVDLCKDKTNP